MRRNRFQATTEEFASTATQTPLGAILRHGLWRNSGGPSTGRRFLKYFCFVYTIGGETEYEDEVIGVRRLVPGDLLLVHPGIAHRYGNGKAGWDEYFVLFEGPLFELWRGKNLLDVKEPIIHLEPLPYWQERLASCARGTEDADLASTLKRLVDLQRFIAEVIGARSARDQADGQPWLAQACHRLESNLSESIDWSVFSRSLGLSPGTFSKLFSKAMGMSPHRYRSAKIIDRACQLSLEEGKLGKEIASALGFATEQHFSRRFKQITGLTLSQFRRQWRARSQSIVPE